MGNNTCIKTFLLKTWLVYSHLPRDLKSSFSSWQIVGIEPGNSLILSFIWPSQGSISQVCNVSSFWEFWFCSCDAGALSIYDQRWYCITLLINISSSFLIHSSSSSGSCNKFHFFALNFFLSVSRIVHVSHPYTSIELKVN